MVFSALVGLLLAVPALASPEILENNLVYRSPYTNDRQLALDTQAIHARHEQAKREIDVTLRKRQAQQVKPSGQDDTYTYDGYGLGVASWKDSTYVYAGTLNFTHAVASGRSPVS
jgi:alkaline phosphatase D